MKFAFFMFCLCLLLTIQANAQIINYFGGNKESQDSVRVLLENMEEPTLMNRGNYGRARSNFGPESIEAKQALRKMIVNDSLNIQTVISIYHKFGWPKASQVGWPAVNTAALQIQHASDSIQEVFLPIFKKATKKGEFNKAVLGTLEDRVLTHRRKRQLYGTQYGVRTSRDNAREVLIWPIKTPHNIKKINRRRLKMDLEVLDTTEVKFDPNAKVKDFL